MPGAGAVQITCVALICLQLAAGSRPLAPPLSLATMIAFISALVGVLLTLGLADIDGMVMAPGRDPWPAPSPAQMPAPAAARISTVSTAIQRGWRNQRRGGPVRSGPSR